MNWWKPVPAILAMLLAPDPAAVAQTNGAAAAQNSPILLANQDADFDGIPDNIDPDPLIASYTALKWEVTDVSLDYDIKHQVTITGKDGRNQSSSESSRGSFSWAVGGDGRVEANVRGSLNVSLNPLKMFSGTGLESSLGFSGSAFVRSGKSRMDDSTSESSRQKFLSIEDQSAMGDLHLGFSVNVRSLSNVPLLMRVGPLPVLVGGQHLMDATLAGGDHGALVEIPADRPDGVLVRFRAEVNNTRAYQLLHSLRNGLSPTIDLARSTITIKARNDASEVDLVSKLRRIESGDCLLTVRTPYGSVSWRVARTQGLRPVTLRQAMLAVNALTRRESGQSRDYFDLGTGGLKAVGGFENQGLWVLGSEGTPSLDAERLNAPLPLNCEVVLVDRDFIAADADMVVKATGQKGQEKVLNLMEENYSQWQAGAKAGWPKALWLMGKCTEYGVRGPKDETKAFQFYEKAASNNGEWSYAFVELGICYLVGTGVSKNNLDGLKWIKKGVGKGDQAADVILGGLYLAGIGVSKDEAEAVKWFKKSAEKGCREGATFLGCCYRDGRGVPKDDVEAVKWFRKAAEQGYPDAETYLGCCYRDGTGVIKNEIEAVKWFKKAALKGDDTAETCLGSCYSKGVGVSKDETEAVKWFRKAADQGNDEAEVCLGICYRDGIGVLKDETEAVKWFRSAADEGNDEAETQLGLCYLTGVGVLNNAPEAVGWFRRAAEKGNAEAGTCLGFCYRDGVGVSKDATEAVRWFRQAADQGNDEAVTRLGSCYRDGVGVSKDTTEAVKYYRKAAGNGYATAEYELGRCYFFGRGVTVDDNEAVRWFRKGAENGDANAEKSLGVCYQEGRGVPKDEVEGVSWFRRAAMKGNADAEVGLGMCYLSGKGVSRDEVEAVRWFRSAAGKGNGVGEFWLGLCYRDGNGVSKDYQQAVHWLSKSAEKGDGEAEVLLKGLQSRIRGEN